MNEDFEEIMLSRIRHLRKEGKHKEALEKLMSLREEKLSQASPGCGGCGQFILSDWIDLAKVYAPARIKLKEMLTAKTALILQDSSDVSIFADVAFINYAFDGVQATVDLFRKIEASSPESAGKLSEFALQSLIDAKQYSSARKYLSSPDVEYSRLKHEFIESRLYLKEEFPDLSQEAASTANGAFEKAFIEGVLRLISVLQHTNEVDAALEIEKEAASLVGAHHGLMP